MARTLMQEAAASAKEHESSRSDREAHQAGFLLGARWGRRRQAASAPLAPSTSEVAAVVDAARLQWDRSGRREPLTAAVTRAVMGLLGDDSVG